MSSDILALGVVRPVEQSREAQPGRAVQGRRLGGLGDLRYERQSGDFHPGIGRLGGIRQESHHRRQQLLATEVLSVEIFVRFFLMPDSLN